MNKKDELKAEPKVPEAQEAPKPVEKKVENKEVVNPYAEMDKLKKRVDYIESLLKKTYFFEPPKINTKAIQDIVRKASS